VINPDITPFWDYFRVGGHPTRTRRFGMRFILVLTFAVAFLQMWVSILHIQSVIPKSFHMIQIRGKTIR
jgi:hypothetical protein